MEMTISLPIAAPPPPAKASAKSSGDKIVGSPFGEILGLTLENVSIPKEKDLAADGNVPQTILSAMFALLQPTMTNVQPSSEVMKSAIENPQVTSANLSGPPVAIEAGFAPRMIANATANAPNDHNTASMIPLSGQPLLVDAGATQATTANAKQILPNMTTVQQPPAPLANLPGVAKTTDDLEVHVMSDTPAYSKIMDVQTQAKQDRDTLTLLSNRIPAPVTRIPAQPHQQEDVTQPAAGSMNAVSSSREDRAAAPNVLQSDNKITLGLNPKSTEEWQFDGSEHHGEQTQLNEAPSVKNEVTASTALFQSIMEKQSGAKPFEAVPSQPQQQTLLADNYDVTSQIVEHAKLISRPQNTEMIIKLKPEHLGELTFKVAVEQGVMTATFHSANPEVRNIIETSLPQLKQELSNQGIKLDNVGVFAGMDQFLSGDQRGGQQYQQSEIPLSRKHNADFAETVTEVLMQAKPGTNDGGVDYRV